VAAATALQAAPYAVLIEGSIPASQLRELMAKKSASKD
jgi:hypothetical protein